MEDFNFGHERERQACDALAIAIQQAVSDTLNENVNWYKTLGIIVYHAAELCRYQSGAETAELNAVCLNALCLSNRNHVQIGNLELQAQKFKFEVQAPPEIAGFEDDAATIILRACEDIFTDLVEFKFSQKTTRH